MVPCLEIMTSSLFKIIYYYSLFGMVSTHLNPTRVWYGTIWVIVGLITTQTHNSRTGKYDRLQVLFSTTPYLGWYPLYKNLCNLRLLKIQLAWATLGIVVNKDGTTLGLRGAMPPTPPKASKKNSLVYISIENILLALKLIYLAPLSQTIYKLTHETKNEKYFQIIPCSFVPRTSRKKI